MKINERQNEVEIKNSNIKEIDINLHEVLKSVCKIIYKNNYGTGFLIKLFKENKELFCLMTNEHVITKEMIESKEIINIKYNYEKKWIQIKLDSKSRFILYNKEMDITIIDVKDKIKEKYFLLPNINNNKDYINKEIYIVQYPEGKNLSFSEGKIKDIVNNELLYDASTKRGSSGSPILLKNTTEVIGIHKHGCISREENYGSLIHPILQLLNNNEKLYENDKNFLRKKENDIKNGDGNLIKNKLVENDTIFYENGEYYIGQSLNGLRYGKGILFYKDGKIKYDGYFVNDKYEGKGKFIWEDGNYYDGQWLNGHKHGKGIEYYKNGSIKYDGDFANDKAEGNGKYIWEDGNSYIGQWMNGLKHGKGILFYKSGEIEYDGNFVYGKREGK